MDKTLLSPIPDKVITAKINKLRDQRKEFINKHEFLKAQEIDKEIAKVKQEVIDRQKQIIQLDFEQKIRDHVKVFNEALDKLEVDFKTQVHTVRVRYHRFFSDTQLSQKTELLNAEREYRDTISRENLRKIPDCEKKLELSRKAAMNGQYDEAIMLKNEATQIAKKDLEERNQKVDKEFNDKRDKLLSHFEESMRQLASKFDIDLASIEKKKRQAIEMENENRASQIKSTFSKYALKLVQSGAIKESIEASKLLESDLREILGELGCPMPKELDKEIAPSTPTSPKTNQSFQSGRTFSNDDE